jgi:hypothetical protein
MRNQYQFVILGFVLSFLGLSSPAQAGGSLLSLLQENGAALFAALPGVITAQGTAVQDVAWPGYRLMDANGVLKVFSDVTGPDTPGATYSVSSQMLWGVGPKLRLQTRYADFGGNCDLNNPSSYIDWIEASAPQANYGNGLASTVYQSGTFNTCDGNAQYSQGAFSPTPYMTRAAWTYRACRLISTTATSAQIAYLAARVRNADPVATSGTGVDVLIKTPSFGETAPAFNWCNSLSAPSGNDYNSMFRAFYPGRTIPQSVLIHSQNSPEALKVASAMRPVGGWPNTTPKPLPNPVPVYSAPEYKEKLVDVVAASNAFIDTLSASDQQSLESACVSGGAQPTVEQIKAVNAWRALFLTVCMDPGWNLL